MVAVQIALQLFRDELLQLATKLQKGGRPKPLSQITSQLAALLYEAQRRNASRSWNYATLGQFAQQELGLRPKTYAKYRKAGENLFKYYPQEFAALIAAIAQGTQRPRLLEVSKLETIDRLVRNPSADAVDMLERGGSLRTTTELHALERFGSASEEEKAVLRALDKVLADIDDVRAKMGTLDIPTITHDGRDRLVQKLEASAPTFDACWTEMDRLAGKLRGAR